MKRRRRRSSAALQYYRLFTGLYPYATGTGDELWIVKCSKCPFRGGPESLLEAKRLARVHDASHQR